LGDPGLRDAVRKHFPVAGMGQEAHLDDDGRFVNRVEQIKRLGVFGRLVRTVEPIQRVLYAKSEQGAFAVVLMQDERAVSGAVAGPVDVQADEQRRLNLVGKLSSLRQIPPMARTAKMPPVVVA